ncbi:MAG: hypothetical protein RLP44_31805 [Aggregatilineales bacterium]
MDNLRRWQLEPNTRFSLYLAADARLSRTSYLNDQVWELTPSAPDSPALLLQTRYGGRVGLATIIPMWIMDGQSIYETSSYATAPTLTAFAPGYAQVEGNITQTLQLTAEYRVIDSQVICGQFTLTNSGDSLASLHVDLLAQVLVNKQEKRLAILSLSDTTYALSMGMLTGLEPVLLFEGATADLDTIRVSPKIGRDITVPAGESITLRWVHAGMNDMQTSLTYTQHTLNGDWDAMLADIINAAHQIPDIHTGDDSLDLALALSYHQLAQAFLDPADATKTQTTNRKPLPYTHIVATRHPDKGYSPSADGLDYGRGWNGLIPQTTYLATLAAATFDTARAQDLVKNYIEVQKHNGWIDFRPGPSGQESGLLMTPLLARLTWECFQISGDVDFLGQVFSGLLKFFRRWFQADVDVEFDGIPEWQDEHQTGYSFFPTFSTAIWAQGVNIKYLETPDLATYLLSEGLSLLAIAHVLNDNIAEATLHDRVEKLRIALDSMWKEGRYTYRDRDTDGFTTPVDLLTDGYADEEHILAYSLDIPSRLIVQISGGTGRMPRASVHIEGKDKHGNKIVENVEVQKGFVWGYTGGSYNSIHTYTQVDKISSNGLSRVFKMNVKTVDTSRLDINALMPIWSKGIPQDKAETLVTLLTDETHFWQPNGVTMVSAQDANYDPSSANGGGGVWAYWLTALGDGLINYGRQDVATTMLQRFMGAQVSVLNENHHFSEFYHSALPQGLGESGYLTGTIPLHLFARVIGVNIVSTGKVWTGGAFHWESPITIHRTGVTVTRSTENTTITFPSGHEVLLNADADYQLVEDPSAVAESPVTKTLMVKPPRTTSNRVIIEIDHDTDQTEDDQP